MLAIVGVCSMAVQGAAIGPIVKRLGERNALLFGLVLRRRRLLHLRRGADRRRCSASAFP